MGLADRDYYQEKFWESIEEEKHDFKFKKFLKIGAILLLIVLILSLIL